MALFANPNSLGAAFELTPGEKFECPGIDAAFDHPHRLSFEHDSFRNLNRTGYIDQQANQFRKERYFLPIEEREDTQWNGLDQNRFAPYATASVKRFYDKAQTTHRQTRQSRRNGNLSQVDREMGAHSFQQQFTHARPTHKETVKVRDYVGIAATNEHGTTRSREAECNATHRGLKEGTLIGYTPGPHKTHVPNGSCDTNITIKNQLSNEENIHPLQPTVPFQRIQTKYNCGTPTAMTSGDRIDEFNRLLDLTIALPQLSDNPFALTPFSTAPGV